MPASRERVTPSEGQESVWDYPRPPACLPSPRHVVVRHEGVVVANTRGAWRVLETSHPPTWYVPPSDITAGAIRRSDARSTFCEWKGAATYWDVLIDGRPPLLAAGWSYEQPSPGFGTITGFLAFAPARMECYVDDEPVRPQEGGFYGGWITDDVVGPFKGGRGTLGW